MVRGGRLVVETFPPDDYIPALLTTDYVLPRKLVEGFHEQLHRINEK